MKNVSIYPYRMASASARTLAHALNSKRVREYSHTFKPRNKRIINWGNPRLPLWGGAVYATDSWLNAPDAVSQCSNKLEFFQLLEGAGLQDCIPEFTTDINMCSDWRQAGCGTIERTLLTASAGRGARYVGPDEPLNEAPLYVKYFKKKDEYRVHFGPLGIFHVQHKRKRLEEENANFKIRNHDNGWVFTINDVHPPAAVMDVCTRVVAAVPLDFGAIDVVYNELFDQAKVLEINTACGLEGTTLNKYVDMFREVLR